MYVSKIKNGCSEASNYAKIITKNKLLQTSGKIAKIVVLTTSSKKLPMILGFLKVCGKTNKKAF